VCIAVAEIRKSLRLQFILKMRDFLVAWSETMMLLTREDLALVSLRCGAADHTTAALLLTHNRT
jgi:hypothetical protein